MKSVAVILAGSVSSHTRLIIEGILKCAREQNAEIVIFTCERRYEPAIKHDVGEYKIFQVIDFSKFDGAIIVSTTIYSIDALNILYSRLREAGIPVASLDSYQADMFNVQINNKDSIYVVTRHLIEKHHCRRIKTVTGPLDIIEVQDRLNGFKKALSESNLPFDDDSSFEGNFLKSAGERAILTFLADPKGLPDAIVFQNDQMALGAIDELSRHGVHVPEDILITGFDDDLEAKYFVPSLTSVTRRQDEEGYIACKTVLEAKLGNAGKVNQITTNPVYRESCGCQCTETLDNVAFREEHFTGLFKNEKFLYTTKQMAIKLTTVDSFSQLSTIVAEAVRKIDCDDFYLMLSEPSMKPVLRSKEYGEINEELIYEEIIRQDERYRLLLNYSKEGLGSASKMTAGELFESLSVPQNQGKCFIVFPLHYADHFFGFCVFGGSRFPFESEVVYSWVMNIGNAVENIRRKQAMQIIITRLNNLWGFDTLTDLYNRAGFLKKAKGIWDRHISMNSPVLLLFADIDNLKTINDRFGHDEGDKCISAFSKILKENQQHGDLLMRYGGDEFVILLERASVIFAQQYMETIQNAIDLFNSGEKTLFELSVSIGYSIVQPSNSWTIQNAIDMADARMYKSKKDKKQRLSDKTG